MTDHDQRESQAPSPASTTATTGMGSNSGRAALTGALRGMDFAAGAQALVPREVQLSNVQAKSQAGVDAQDGDASRQLDEEKGADPQSLLDEAPTTTQAQADWLLRAQVAGFVYFKHHQEQVESLKDGEQVDGLKKSAKSDTPDLDAPILAVEIDLVKARIRKWIEGGSQGDKNPIAFGSFVRTKAGKHTYGNAIDINDLSQTTSVGPVIAVLQSLNSETESSYGIGLPFQGEFFDPADAWAAKKKAAEGAARKGAETTARVTGAVINGSTHVFDATGTFADGQWTWPALDTDDQRGAHKEKQSGAAYKRLKSGELKSELGRLRSSGFTLAVFPDNDDHMHLDRR